MQQMILEKHHSHWRRTKAILHSSETYSPWRFDSVPPSWNQLGRLVEDIFRPARRQDCVNSKTRQSVELLITALPIIGVSVRNFSATYQDLTRGWYPLRVPVGAYDEVKVRWPEIVAARQVEKAPDRAVFWDRVIAGAGRAEPVAAVVIGMKNVPQVHFWLDFRLHPLNRTAQKRTLPGCISCRVLWKKSESSVRTVFIHQLLSGWGS